MRHRALPLALVAALPLAFAAATAGAASPGRNAPQVTDDGLERVQIRNVDQVYRRAGADFGQYSKVLIAPVSVQFSRAWNPRDYGRFGLSADQVNRIRADVATLARETFAKALAEGGWQVVDAPGEGVLEVHPDIVDLYVNAPEPMEPGRSRSYVLSAGEMTLALELRDAVTGTVLARARDRKRDPDRTWLEWANEVTNRAEAERALRGWAEQLRGALEAARRGR